MPKVIFIDAAGRRFEIDAEEGQSVMQVATSHMVPGIVGDCGGFLNCATCHSYIDAGWRAKLEAPSEDEKAMIGCALEPNDDSRLTCQIRMTAALDGLVVHIPRAQS